MRAPAHPHSHPHTHPSWPHPHPHHNHSHRSHLHAGHEECPSPASSDSDSLMPTHSPTRAAAVHAPVASAGYPNDHPGVPGAYGNRTPGADVAFTPSTSPFLGGMRKLAIHSTGPSRAPSPFHLPPPGLDSPTEAYPHGHRLGAPDSPPTGKLGGRKRNSTGDLVSLSHHASLSGPYLPYSSERNSAYLPTPQLSSGPSSNGSSPRSYANSLYNGASGGAAVVGSGSLSASSSRAPSPPHWQQQHSKAQQPHGRDHTHHHHLAHSVRAAFGMTPIHPRGRPTSGSFPSHNARPHSDSTTPPHFTPMGPGSESTEMSAVPSVPGSRASSPPIKLPPLKLPSSPSSPNNRPAHVAGLQSLLNNDEDTKSAADAAAGHKRVELPRFSEIEAATGLR